MNGSYWTNGVPAIGPALIWTACGLVLAAVLAIRRWPQRFERRGFGLACWSLVVFGADLGFLLFAAARAGHPTLWP